MGKRRVQTTAYKMRFPSWMHNVAGSRGLSAYTQGYRELLRRLWIKSCLQVLDFSHHLPTGSVFLQNATEPIGDLIVSMNFLDEYVSSAPSSDVAIVLVMAFFAVS